jgi:hypothetical protein
MGKMSDDDRNELGRVAREAFLMTLAEELRRPDPPPWLHGWEKMTERERERWRRVGEASARHWEAK